MILLGFLIPLAAITDDRRSPEDGYEFLITSAAINDARRSPEDDYEYALV